MEPQRKERFWLKHITLDELPQLGWGDMANYFCERDKKYGITESKPPAIVNLQMDEVAAASALITFGELFQSLDIVFGEWNILQGTSRLRSGHIRLGSGKRHTNKCIMSRLCEKKPHSSLSKKT